ncbi:MAG: hypothetical protein M1818_007470 [Claussenomyces sp. TS43310]|nr:MAG: hypothetical protein M1818_007470 [Claussenomyces sp. TS43310]
MKVADSVLMAGMRAPPTIEAQRDDFRVETSPNVHTICQLYYTPLSHRGAGAPPEEPDQPDFSSPRSRGGSTNVCPQFESDHTAAMQTYQTALAPALALQPDFIFTHGKGSRLDNPTIVAFAQGFARTHRVLCFEGDDNMVRRTVLFRSLANLYPTATVVGGRSMGSRAAVRSAIYSPIKKLIFFTYPLTRDLQERYEELLALDCDTDVLFIVGDMDPLCIELLLKPVRARMRARSWWIRMVNGDHALWWEPEAARHNICNVAGQLAAKWHESRDPALTEMTLRISGEQVVWDAWHAPTVETNKALTTLTVSTNGTPNFNFTLPG